MVLLLCHSYSIKTDVLSCKVYFMWRATKKKFHDPIHCDLWGEEDLNPRRHKPSGPKPDPFDHSGISPRKNTSKKKS